VNASIELNDFDTYKQLEAANDTTPILS